MILGITGGIGSGKTTVCGVFNVLGIPVFQTDMEARILMDTDVEVRLKLNSLAGKDLYTSGTLDRKALSDLIFSDKQLLAKVNAIVHPLVFEKFREWVPTQTSPYVILESAILFESKGHLIVDKIAAVITPEEERLERVALRSKLTKSQIIERMENQIKDDERIQLSDFIIPNSDQDMIIPVILRIHDDLLKIING